MLLLIYGSWIARYIVNVLVELWSISMASSATGMSLGNNQRAAMTIFLSYDV